MTPEPFDGWTPEGLGIALRMTKGDLAPAPRRRWQRVIGIGIAALFGCLAVSALALLAWHWLGKRIRA